MIHLIGRESFDPAAILHDTAAGTQQWKKNQEKATAFIDITIRAKAAGFRFRQNIEKQTFGFVLKRT
jgi:hypothetical protein